MASEQTTAATQPESPYETLGLLDTAPLDLVVEVYWAAVRDLVKAPQPDAEEALDRLNHAYGEITGGASPLDVNGGDPVAREPPATAGLFGRVLRRGPSQQAPPDPCRLLSVSIVASDEVIDIAYRYTRGRLRGRLGPDAAVPLAELDDAYRKLRGAAPPAATPVGEDLPAEQQERSPSRTSLLLGGAVASVGRWSAGVAASGWRGVKAWAANPLLEERGPEGKIEVPPAASGPDAKPPVPLPRRPVTPPVAKNPPQTALGPGSTPKPKAPPRKAARPAHAANRGPTGGGGSPRPANRGPTGGEGSPRPANQGPTGGEGSPGSAIRLEGKDGTVALGPRAIVVGTGDACDIVAPAPSPDTEIAVSIWAEEDRVVLHTIEGKDAVSVNGAPAVWAFLEDGDEIAIGGARFTLRERVPAGNA